MTLSSNVCDQLYEIARNQNGANVRVCFNGVETLIVQRIEDADYILRLNASNYRKNMHWFQQTLGLSRFSEDGRDWEIRRNLTQTYFNRFDREKAFQLASNYGEIGVERLITHSLNAPVIDDNILREMTASVVIDNFFGVQLGDTKIDLTALAELMAISSDYSFVPKGKTNALYRNRLSIIPNLRRRILDQLSYFRMPEITRTPLLKDLLQADAREEDRVIFEHEMLTFIAAGSETTAATMSWVCYLLALYPEIQDRLRVNVIQYWNEYSKSWNSLSQLKALARFISEALRLFPPTPIVARYAIDDDVIGDTVVSPGQNIMVSFIGIHHDARFRKDPWQLNIDDKAETKPSGDTMAFSIGPRVCGGKQFALLEMVTFLSVFLRKAHFTLTSAEPPTFFWKSQMLRDGGQPVRVEALL